MEFIPRLYDELRSVGFTPTGFGCGAPHGDWEPDNPVVVALCAVHITDENTYLTSDLTVSAAALQGALGDDVDKWEAYLEVQTSLIRTRRYDAYTARGGVNDVYHEIKSDGGTDAAAKAAAGSAKQAVKNQYPWPGSYR